MEPIAVTVRGERRWMLTLPLATPHIPVMIEAATP
jgi:hypothetical protein